MDNRDLFGEPPLDWEFFEADLALNSDQNRQYYSQEGALFDEFHYITKGNRNTLDVLNQIGWQLYFPNKESIQSSRTTNKHIRSLEKHYLDFRHDYSPSEAIRCGCFEFKLNLAKTDLHLKDTWSTFEDDLSEFPEYILACIGLAMYRTVAARNHQTQPFASTPELAKITPRLHYFGNEKSIGTIDASYTDKLITIRGSIERISEPCVTSIWRAYKCKFCNVTIVLRQQHNHPTTRQKNCSRCNAGDIEYCSASCLNWNETHQNITVQGIAADARNNNSIVVKVPGGLVKGLKSGAHVTITGIVKVDPNKYIQAVCIKNDADICSVERKFHANDIEAIMAIRSESCLFKLLVQSLCPQVVGMETIKAGLLLALFSTSCDTHVLLADNESGISQKLLERCISASSKGVWLNNPYENMRATNTQFKSALEYPLAEPTVHPSMRVCCIERIDKLEKLNTLEFIFNETPLQTTLLTSATLINGVFDGKKPFMDNLFIPRALMERFALVFLMEDTVIPEDDLVCFNGVRLHPEKPSNSKCSVEIPLVRQLRLKPDERCDLLPTELIRKYIDYARLHCAPEFTEKSTALLESFFSQMYSMPQWLNITNGMKMVQIQNMVRARARVNLSPEITTEHVMDTIRIVSRSWYDKYDTDDRAPAMRLPTRKKGVKAAGMSQFLDMLRTRSVQLKTKSFTIKQLRAYISEMDLPGVEDEIVEKLNIQGYLLKKSDGCYQLLV